MLAKRTTTPTVFSGVIALTLYGCSLQDYDYLGAGNGGKNSDDETEEPQESSDPTSSGAATVDTLTSQPTEVTSDPDASVTTDDIELEAGASTVAQSNTTSGPTPTSAPDDTSTSSASQTSLPIDTSSVVEDTSVAPLPPLVVEGNVIANSSFETPVQGWQVIGSATMQATPAEAHTGSRSLVCKNRTQSWEAPGIDVLTLITPGQTYMAKAWVMTDAVDGATFKMQRKARCIIDGGLEAQDEPLAYAQLSSAFASPGEWVLLESAPFSPFEQRNCEIVEFVIYFEGPPEGADIYVDDVSLVPYTP